MIDISIIDVTQRCGICVKDNTNGAEVKARCPFCGDSQKQKPTASINKDKNLFYCHRCGEGHNAITLFAKLIGTDNRQAYRELTETLQDAA